MDEIKPKMVKGEPVCVRDCPSFISHENELMGGATCKVNDKSITAAGCIPGLKEQRDGALRKWNRLKKEQQKNIRCSYCGKTAKEVKTLIAGDSRVFIQIYICDECIGLSAEMVAKREKEKEDGINS